MGVLFGNNFDSDLNETCTSAVPDNNTGLTRETSISKFGIASMGALSGSDLINWLNFPYVSANSGAIGFFIRTALAIKTYSCEITLNDNTSNNNKIILSILNGPVPSTHNIILSMYDSSGFLVISSATFSGSFVPSNVWNYYEINWLWNSLSGITEVSHNGTVRITTAAGNPYTRQGSANTDVQIRMGTGLGDDYIDDFVVLPARSHIGNFSVPTVSQVICNVGQVSFGSQLNRFGAGFSR